MLDLFGNHIVGFPTRRLIYGACMCSAYTDSKLLIKAGTSKLKTQNFIIRTSMDKMGKVPKSLKPRGQFLKRVV